MKLPQNPFKQAILSGQQQVGLWCMLPGGYVTRLWLGPASTGCCSTPNMRRPIP